MGEYLKAIEFHERSLEIAQRIKDAQGEKSALSNIGFAYKYLGEYNKAIEFHEKSLEIAQRIGDVKGEAVELKVISIIHDSMKKNEKAGQTVNHDRAHITGPGLPHVMGLIGVFFIELTEFPSLFDGLLLELEDVSLTEKLRRTLIDFSGPLKETYSQMMQVKKGGFGSFRFTEQTQQELQPYTQNIFLRELLDLIEAYRSSLIDTAPHLHIFNLLFFSSLLMSTRIFRMTKIAELDVSRLSPEQAIFIENHFPNSLSVPDILLANANDRLLLLKQFAGINDAFILDEDFEKKVRQDRLNELIVQQVRKARADEHERHQRELAKWEALPRWKRLFVKKPILAS